MIMYFKLKPRVGNHTQKNEKGEIITFTHQEGKVIESEVDLVAKHPEKFERVNTPSSEDFKEPLPPEDADDEDADEREPIGKDRTDKFEIAGVQDFKVFYKQGKGYFVTEAETPFDALNEKGLKKAKVEAFIESRLEA